MQQSENDGGRILLRWESEYWFRLPRSAATAGAVLFIVLLIVSPLSGCGNDTGQAAHLVQQGDQALTQLMENVHQFEIKAKTAAESSSDPTKLTSELPQIVTAGEAISRKVDEAQHFYDKVLSLSASDDYKRYALMRQDELDLVGHLISVVSGYFKQGLNSAGSEVSPQEFIAITLTPAAAAITLADREAARFKDENQL